PSRSAGTRSTWWGNRRAATVRRVRRGSRRAASGPAPGAGTCARIPPWGARRAGNSGSGCGATRSSALRGELHADAAVADEPAGAVEHWLSTHPELLLRAIGIDAAEEEIGER